MTANFSQIVGIDYGSKLAGTTVIAYIFDKTVRLIQTAKKEDADEWLSQKLEEIKPMLIAIDAPLSLPMVYNNPSSKSNYFYRDADIETKAMSPMFIGGLTARAMKLCATHPQYQWIETYPSMIQRTFGWKEITSDFNLMESILSENLQIPIANTPTNKHQVDALCALLSGIRYVAGKAICFGDKTEGQIWV